MRGTPAAIIFGSERIEEIISGRTKGELMGAGARKNQLTKPATTNTKMILLMFRLIKTVHEFIIALILIFK